MHTLLTRQGGRRLAGWVGPERRTRLSSPNACPGTEGVLVRFLLRVNEVYQSQRKRLVMKSDVLMTWLAELDIRLGAVMEKWGLFCLRVGVGVVYFWFGILKPFGLSPADDMVLRTTYWIPIPHFLVVLGIWEMAIGICFVFPQLLRAGIILLFLHLPGTLLPFLLLPQETFQTFPYVLTLEGQYIVKNVVLAAAGLVIGGAIRHRLLGFSRFAPDEFNSLIHLAQWTTASPGVVLAQEGHKPERLFLIHTGLVSIRRGEEEVAQMGPGRFVGEMSFMTGGTASASVRVLESARLMYWDQHELTHLLGKDAKLQHAFFASVNLDLVEKLQIKH